MLVHDLGRRQTTRNRKLDPNGAAKPPVAPRRRLRTVTPEELATELPRLITPQAGKEGCGLTVPNPLDVICRTGGRN